MWIPVEVPPPISGNYWLIDTYGRKQLAFFTNSGKWKAMNCGGEAFLLTDTYTHWTTVLEPSGSSLRRGDERG